LKTYLESTQGVSTKCGFLTHMVCVTQVWLHDRNVHAL